MYYVYILRNSKNKLYIGYTTNIEQRLKYHNCGKGAKMTREQKGFKLVYFEEFPNEINATQREKQLKGWTRAKKEALISEDLELLKRL